MMTLLNPTMKIKYYFLLFNLFIVLFSYSQSQDINGINLNGPNGFIKSGNLTWTKGNDLINVISYRDVAISKKDYEIQCRKGSRTTEFLLMEEFEINGTEYPICLQIGDNDMIVGQTIIYRDGYSYIVTVGTYPGDYDSNTIEEITEESLTQIGYMLGYMVVRVTLY